MSNIAEPPPLNLRDAIEGVDREGNGAIDIQLIAPDAVEAVFRRAFLLADPDAESLAAGVIQQALRVANSPPDNPARCLGCDVPLPETPYTTVIVTGHAEDAEHALGAGVCLACAPTRVAALEHARSYLRKLWPELRPITVHPSRGRA